MAALTIPELAALLGCDATVVRGVAAGLALVHDDAQPLTADEVSSLEAELLATGECVRGLLPPAGADVRVFLDASALMESGAEPVVRGRLVPLGTPLLVPLSVNGELIRHAGDARPTSQRGAGTRALILLNALRKDGLAELVAGVGDAGWVGLVRGHAAAGQRVLLVTQQSDLATAAAGHSVEVARVDSGIVVPWRPVVQVPAAKVPAPAPSPQIEVRTTSVEATSTHSVVASLPRAPAPQFTGGVPKTLCQGRYKVQTQLGGGQHSAVYQCYDTERDERVAVKVLTVASNNPDIVREMFKREVGALEGFAHDHIVPMLRYEPEEEQGRLNIILELVSGGQTLEHLIQGKGEPFPAASSLRWRIEQLLGILSVIERAHTRGIIHRDVKLSNVLVDREHMRLRLADFGIARILENYGKAPGGATLREFYTLPFAAPEQVYGRDTSFPADLHAFGVMVASTLAWRIPERNFPPGQVATFLDAFVTAHADVATKDPTAELIAYLNGETLEPDRTSALQLLDVIRRLLDPNPSERPRLPDVQLALRMALDATIERRVVPVVVTTSVREKARSLGFEGTKLLGDLNEGLRLLYQPEQEQEGRGWSIRCFGRQGQARLVPAQGEPGKLKMVEFLLPHATDLARIREEAFALPFTLIEGEGSAQPLFDAVWEEHQRRIVTNEERGQRESLLEVARFVLEKQRERIDVIRVKYRLEGDDSSPSPAPERPATATADGAPRAQPRPEMRRVAGQVVEVRVVAVLMGRHADVGDAEMTDDTIPPEIEEALASDSGFSYRGRDFANAHGYDPESRTLTLKLTRAMTLPVNGEILCEDVATKTSLNRQEAAVSTFLDDQAVNARLGTLLLHPEQNSLDERQPVELIQPLEPAGPMSDLVSRVLAARDIFTVQGPPGTGKTTLITEVVAQILRREPTARVLVTSQANEAVDNAMDALRALDRKLDTRWRGVRDRRGTLGRNIGFDNAFAGFAKQTREASHVAEQRLDAHAPQADAIRSALANWREKLPYIPDAKVDYAEAVQLWGMTLLRIPTLKKLLREVRFDYVIVDEAARATPAELMVSMVVGKRLVLVGDHKQLPPFMDNETEEDLRQADLDVDKAKRSMFEALFERLGETNKSTLRVNFRMHRSIGDTIGALYYPTIGLVTGVPDADRTLNLKLFGGDQRIFWLDVVDGRERQLRDSTSWINDPEVAAIDRLLESMERELAGTGTSYTVGIIAAYGDQRDRLRDKIRPQSQRWKALREIRIATVDAFQGKQDDIVVYSNVRANTAELRFISQKSRLNVAFSRAKRLLVIAGHFETAKQSPQIKQMIDRILPKNVVSVRGGR